jgi:hypothetical protein
MLRKVPGYRMHLYLCLSNDSALMDECCVHTDERPVLGDTSSSSRRGHMPQYAVLRKRVYDAYAAEQRGLPQRHAFDQELQRRKMALFLYLIRSPIFDRCVTNAYFDTCSSVWLYERPVCMYSRQLHRSARYLSQGLAPLGLVNTEMGLL